MSRRGGYTLAEILACILVLTALAAILFPIFAQAREHSGPTCLSNPKSLGTALQIYLQDYDGTFPPKNTDGAASGGDWDARLYP